MEYNKDIAYEKFLKENPNYRQKIHITRVRISKEEDKKRHRARLLMMSAVRWHRLFKKPCEVCGAEKVEGHHPDYSKPLEVIWLCPKHHRELHNNIVYKSS